MSISFRLKEERLRLGLSQAAFAALAGATKSAQIKWEREQSSAPTAPALQAFAEAGADVLYILTGRRTNAGPDLSLTQIEEQIAKARADLLNPYRYPQVGESPDATEERVLQHQIEMLGLMVAYKGILGTPEQIAEVENLLDIATDPEKLLAFRAADNAQLRAKRKQIRDRIASYMKFSDREPSEEAISMMAGLIMDYNVPIGPMVDLAGELMTAPDADA